MTPSFPLYIGLPHPSDLKRFFKLLPARRDQRAPLPPSPPPLLPPFPLPAGFRGALLSSGVFLYKVFAGFFFFFFSPPNPHLPIVLKAKQAPGGGERRARGRVGPHAAPPGTPRPL